MLAFTQTALLFAELVKVLCGVSMTAVTIKTKENHAHSSSP